ncbi:MAG: hypothetical protein VX899_21645 [Myxococcota bacterium]|nr:hypothetical protein [Myxococcota bacterium]
MLNTDDAFLDALTQAVDSIETTTTVEVVVVIAPSSGSYRDLSLLAGGCAAALGLCVALFAPVDFHSAWIPVDLLVLAAAAHWVVGRWPWALAHIASRSRKAAQVDLAADAAFHRERVHDTPERQAVLVYISLLEGEVRLVPDAGVARHIPPAELKHLHWDLSTSEDTLASLGRLGDLLAAHLPGQSAGLIPNHPRVLP